MNPCATSVIACRPMAGDPLTLSEPFGAKKVATLAPSGRIAFREIFQPGKIRQHRHLVLLSSKLSPIGVTVDRDLFRRHGLFSRSP